MEHVYCCPDCRDERAECMDHWPEVDPKTGAAISYREEGHDEFLPRRTCYFCANRTAGPFYRYTIHVHS